MDKANFEREHNNFFKKLKEISEIWRAYSVDIWKTEETTPTIPWMDKVQRLLIANINNAKELNITEKYYITKLSKTKNWKAPGFNNIQKFPWKKLEPESKKLRKDFIFERVTEDSNAAFRQWLSGIVVSNPTLIHSRFEKNYQPTIYLNALYKILTGLVARYMRSYPMEKIYWMN